jgi:outer membrane autotransporter protein
LPGLSVGLVLVLSVLGMAAPMAHGQVFVSHATHDMIHTYDATTGLTMNNVFFPNPNGNQLGLALSGNNLYISDYSNGSVGVFNTTTGAAINDSLITGIPTAMALALSGSHLFVGNYGDGTVGVYDATSGATINASLISNGGYVSSLAISGSHLFVGDDDSVRIGVYDAATGAVINASLISGGIKPYGLAVSGNELFVTSGGMVGVYDATTGVAINANLIQSQTAFFTGIALSGNTLFAVDFNSGSVGAYNATTGATINASLIKRLNQPWAIAVANNLAPISATTTGLPMANVAGQMLLSAGGTVTNDLNNHLFNLRAGDGEEDANDSIAALMDEGVVVGQGDGNPDAKNPIAKIVPRSRQWEVFTTVNYGNVKLNAINNQAGVQVDSWAPSVGISRHLSRGLAVGFATTFLTSDQSYTSGLGHLHLEGPALSAYVSFARKNYWSSLLYSFGSYQLDSTRNPGFGFDQAFGSTRTYTNSVQYNTGWNFRFQNNTLVTGPYAGVDYLHGTVNSYSEAGGGAAALAYGRQTYESLVARVGWSATKKIQTSWAAITPQVRVGYERQNITNNGTSVSLINAPFTATGGNQSPGQSYMVAGGGVNFQFNDQFSLLLSYQGQFFRDNMQAHFGSVRLGYKF